MSLPDLPATFPEVHDLLQEMFGIGSYDAIARSEPPYFKTRMNEIARIKAVAKKRRATPQQLGMAAWHARQTGVHVRQALRLFPLIPAAQRAWREAEADEAAAALRAELDDAIADAIEAGLESWAERLARAAHAEVPALLETWRSVRP